MGCKQGTFPFKYLGLLLSDSSLHMIEYAQLIQKVRKRQTRWKAKYLNLAGIITLINAVLSALPTSFMSIFKMLKWTVQELDKIRRNFLWHDPQIEQRKIYLANWESICIPKKLKGLGNINMQIFNTTLMAKWMWQTSNGNQHARNCGKASSLNYIVFRNKMGSKTPFYTYTIYKRLKQS